MTEFVYRLKREVGGVISTPFDDGATYTTPVPLDPGMRIELSHYENGGYSTFDFVVSRVVQSAQMQPMGTGTWRCLDTPVVLAFVEHVPRNGS